MADLSLLDASENVVHYLRRAVGFLSLAGEYATETEKDRTGLIGPTASAIGGLCDSVQALADLIEDITHTEAPE